MARTEQEKLASLVSRIANKRVSFCQNRDGTIDVFVPSRFIVFIIHPDLTVSWRAARDSEGKEIVRAFDDSTREWARAVITKSKIE